MKLQNYFVNGIPVVLQKTLHQLIYVSFVIKTQIALLNGVKVYYYQ